MIEFLTAHLTLIFVAWYGPWSSAIIDIHRIAYHFFTLSEEFPFFTIFINKKRPTSTLFPCRENVVEILACVPTVRFQWEQTPSRVPILDTFPTGRSNTADIGLHGSEYRGVAHETGSR